MYRKIKQIITSLIILLLCVRMFVMSWDPLYGPTSNLSQGLPIYRDWRVFFDALYQYTGYLMWPVYQFWEFISRFDFVPKISWFPYLFTSETLDFAKVFTATLPSSFAAYKAIWLSPFMAQTYQGVIDFLVPMAVGFYLVLNPLLDWLYDSVKNLVWVILVEFSFTKRKEANYKQALDKKASDLMRLNAEYRSLSKEASILAHSVVTDELTRVHNKRFFIDKITQEVKDAQASKNYLSLSMMDIDHFKKLNDTYGHLLGDKVLKAVAQVAKRCTPDDCFCCRFGGEEFAIIMPGKQVDEALKIVGEILRSLPKLRFEEDPELRVTASFGMVVADFKEPEAQALATFDDFIKLADDELYRAKLNGRNRIEYKAIIPQ